MKNEVISQYEQDLPIPADHPLAGHEDSIDALRECGRLFHRRGWSVGTSSNYSAVLSNDPAELIITASGMDKGRLGRQDFVLVGADGQPKGEGQPKSSAETMLHIVVARVPGNGCILHTHSVWGTLLSDHFAPEGGFEIHGYEMLKGLETIRTHEHRKWVPIFENTQDIPSLADQVLARLKDPNSPLTHGLLIRNHGLYAWGKDVFTARRHIEIFEFLFEVIGRKMSFSSK